jgi:hypothetical protein
VGSSRDAENLALFGSIGTVNHSDEDIGAVSIAIRVLDSAFREPTTVRTPMRIANHKNGKREAMKLFPFKAFPREIPPSACGNADQECKY